MKTRHSWTGRIVFGIATCAVPGAYGAETPAPASSDTGA